jgi:hypothetical protein
MKYHFDLDSIYICIFRNHDGQLTVDDLRGVYIVKNHPKYMNGQWSEDEVLKHFLQCFEIGQHKDGIVSIIIFIFLLSKVSLYNN